MQYFQYVDILAFNIKSDYNSKIKYLNSVDVCERLQKLLEDFKRQKFYSEIENKIEDDNLIIENQQEDVIEQKNVKNQKRLIDVVSEEEK